MIQAMPIMLISNKILCIILMPNNGRLVIIKGNTAQCIAHAIEVVIPNASQFILKFIEWAKINNCNYVAKIILNSKLSITVDVHLLHYEKEKMDLLH